MDNAEVVIQEQTKLMNTCRLARALSGVADVTPLHCPATGSHICLLHGADGAIKYIAAGERDYELRDTGLTGGLFRADLDGENRVVAVACDGDRMSYVAQRQGEKFSFANARPLQHGLGSGIRFEAIVSLRVSYRDFLAFAVLYKKDPNQDDYDAAYAYWNGDLTRFIPLPSKMHGNARNVFLLLHNGLELQVIDRDAMEILYIDQQRYERVRFLDRADAVHFAYDPLPAYGDVIYGVIDAYGLNRALGVIVKGMYRDMYWGTITDGMQVKDYACHYYEENIFLFAVDAQRRLYVAACEDVYNEDLPNFLPILEGVDKVRACPCSDHMLAFALDSARGRLYSLLYQPASENWLIEEITVQAEDHMVEVRGYCTQLTVAARGGQGVPNAPVRIEATEITKLIVADAVYRLEPGDCVQARADGRGRLAILQETDDLTCAEMIVSTPGLGADGPLLIKPYQNVERRLRDLTPEQLCRATDKGGRRILPEAHQQDAGAVCQAVQRLFQSVDRGAALDLCGTKATVGCAFQGPRDRLLALTQVVGDPGGDALDFALDFSGGHVQFTPMSRQEGADAIRLLREGSDLPRWLAKIGSWIKAGFKALVDTAKMVVHFAVKAVEFGIELVIKGVRYVLNLAVKVVRDVLGAVQVVLSKVGIDIAPMLEWLGFIFNWDDVLRCKRAFKHAFEQGLIFIKDGAAPLGALVDRRLTGFEADLDRFLRAAEQSVLGTADFSTLMRRDVPDGSAYENAMSNNFLLEGLLKGEDCLLEGVVVDGALEEILAQIKEVLKACNLSREFDEVTAYFKERCASVEELLRGVLGALIAALRGVLKLALASLKAVAALLFRAVAALADAAIRLLSAEVHIPFISQFYQFISGGSEISLMDVAGLVAAVAAAPLYKLIAGKPLFANDAELQSYERAIDARALLRSAGLLSAPAAKACVGAAGLLHRQISKCLETAGVALYYITSLVNDAGANSTLLSALQLGFEFTWQLQSCPWIYADGSISEETPDGHGRKLWCLCWLGVVLDALWFCCTRKYPDCDASGLGPLFSTIYGGLHLLGSLDTFEGAGGISIALTAVPVATEVSKIALHPGISLPPYYIPTWVVCALDALAAPAMLGLTVSAYPGS